jgi:hypothetical protein
MDRLKRQRTAIAKLILHLQMSRPLRCQKTTWPYPDVVRRERAMHFGDDCYPGVTPQPTEFKKFGLSIGAGEGIRTLDPDLGKVVLYP